MPHYQVFRDASSSGFGSAALVHSSNRPLHHLCGRVSLTLDFYLKTVANRHRRWHPTRPTNAADRGAIDHVVVAFAMANNTAAFQPKVPLSTLRAEFPNAKMMIAVGGWGDTIGFSQATWSDWAMQKFASDINTMLTTTGADGVGKLPCSLL